MDVDNYTPPARPQLRWIVRLEQLRPTRFGERPSAGLGWAVTPYLGRTKDGRLLGGFRPTFFPTRSAALRHARDLEARAYKRAAWIREQS